MAPTRDNNRNITKRHENAGAKLSPDYPWLGRRRLQQWYDLFPNWRTIPWDHPQVSARYPANEIGNLRRMLVEAEEFIDRLDRLHQTICHGDTYPTNFMSRGKDGDEQTVALDWALAQVGPIGYDLGGLVFGAYLNRPERNLAEILCLRPTCLGCAIMAARPIPNRSASAMLIRPRY
jgi:aminoglycoside/choline kinase family phosphotransferase